MLFSNPTQQSPRAYDLANLQANQLMARLNTAATLLLRTQLNWSQIAAETAAALAPSDVSVTSPDITGIAFSERYLNANERNGTTECHAKLQAIANMCRDNQWIFLCQPSDVFKTNATVTFYFPGQVIMRGARIVPDTSGVFTGASAIVIDTAATAEGGAEWAGMLMDVAALGPNGYAVPNAATSTFNTLDGIVMNPTHQLNNVVLKLWVSGFRDGVVVKGSNWWLLSFDHPFVNACWRYGWNFSRVANAGENISIFGGVTGNCINAGAAGGGPGTAIGLYENGTTNIDINIHGHSFDYNDFQGQVASGIWNFYGCHNENHNNNPSWTAIKTASYTPTTLNFYGLVPGTGGGGSGWSPAENAGGRPVLISTQGSVAIRCDGKLQSYGITKTALVAAANGTPYRVQTSGWFDTTGQGQQPIFYAGNNSLYNNTLQLNAFTGWTQNQGGGAVQSIDATSQLTILGSGAYSCKLVSTGAGSSLVQGPISVKAGDVLSIQGEFKITAYTAGYVATRYQFKDANGDVIVDSTLNNLAAVGAMVSGAEVIVPAGAVSLTFMFYASGFNGTAYWGNGFVEILR